MTSQRAASVAFPERAPISPRRQSGYHVRSQQVLVRLTADQHADLTRLAEQHGLSLPDVLRAGLTLLAASETP